MDDDLISKKELLELTGISYGQLYRWKRKGLIPEDWFIKKATFTGQETFFPKGRVLSRVERIKSRKEDLSLDELADVFYPNVRDVRLTKAEMEERNIVSSDAITAYLRMSQTEEPLPYEDILFAVLLGRVLEPGDVNLAEAQQMVCTVKKGFAQNKTDEVDVVLLRKMGVFICLLASPPCALSFDEGVKVVGRFNTAVLGEELKLKLV